MRHLPIPPSNRPKPLPMWMQPIYWLLDVSQLAFIAFVVYLFFRSPVQDPELADIMQQNLSWSHQLVSPGLLFVLLAITGWLNFLRIKMQRWQAQFWMYMGCFLIQGVWGLVLFSSLIA